MTVPLQGVPDPATDQNFRQLAQRFPLGGQDIQNDAITATHIAADAVGSSEIATDAVGSAEIAAGAVGTSEAPNFVSSATTPKTLFGVIDTTSPGSITSGTGFTITRNGVGDVTVNFTAAFASAPTVTFTPQLSGVNAVIAEHAAATTTTTARCIVNRRDTGAAADATFHFIAIGPR